MKKLGLFLIICGFFGIAGIAFAYTRTPSGYGAIENPVSFEVLASDMPDYLTYDSVQLYINTGAVQGTCIKVSDNPTGFTDILNLPISTAYSDIKLAGWKSWLGEHNYTCNGGTSGIPFVLETPTDYYSFWIPPFYECSGEYPNGECIENDENPWGFAELTCNNSCNIKPMYLCGTGEELGQCIQDDEVGTFDNPNCNNQCGVSSLYSLPMASTSDMLASVGTLFTDLWVIIATACGIPLGFFVIKRVIGLF
jgi:hypothetical protein